MPVHALAAEGNVLLQTRVEERRQARQLQNATLSPRRRSVVRQPLRRSVQSGTLDRRRDRVRDAVIAATNEIRAEAGLPALTWNVLLQQSAQLHTDDMNARKYFAHDSPEGVTSGDRILATGYGKLTMEDCDCSSYRIDVGENLANGQQSVEQVMHDWMASPKHRDAILHPRFKEIGIGISGRYWAQHFGGIVLNEEATPAPLPEEQIFLVP